MMAESRSQSDKISGVLDWVGFTQDDILWRRDMWRRMDRISNFGQSVIQEPLRYTTGSKAEGLGLSIMESDTDIMFEEPSMRFIYNRDDWDIRQNETNVFIDTSSVHQGYCRLLPMYMDVPKFLCGSNPFVRQLVRQSRRTICFHDRVVVFRSNILPTLDYTQQGPAMTLKSAVCDLDRVKCHRIPWPPSAREWIQRDRPSNYPPKHFIQHSATAHVVPVGYKESPAQHTEWRFSFSLVELDLVRMWSNHVSKCYVLLKLMKQTLASEFPHVSGILCSYHLKTLLFWLTEEMGMAFWNDCSLEECFQTSIEKLVSWVEQGVIPHYFIRTNNLFDREAGTPRHADLNRALYSVMSEGLRFIRRCQLYRNITHKMRTYSRPGGYGQLYLIFERKDCNLSLADIVDIVCVDLVRHCSSNDIRKCVMHTGDVMRRLDTLANQNNDDRSVFKYIENVVRSSCATHILAYLRRNTVSNRKSVVLVRIAEQMFKESHDQLFSLLKKANLYYQLAEYEKAIHILKRFSRLTNDSTVKVCFGQDEFYLSIPTLERLSDVNFQFSNVSTSVIYTKPEMSVIASALQYELFKYEIQPPSTVDESGYARMRNEAVVDPDVFMYYLQYLCYVQTGQRNQAEKAFSELCRVANLDSAMHKSTGLNILGHCYKARGEFRQAVNCFGESIRVQPKINIAPVHLAVLMTEFIQHRNALQRLKISSIPAIVSGH